MSNLCSFDVFMYANNLLLAASSIKDLQELINICLEEFHILNMAVNPIKSSCIKIGPNYDGTPTQMLIGTNDINWESSMRYLGHTLCSGNLGSSL